MASTSDVADILDLKPRRAQTALETILGKPSAARTSSSSSASLPLSALPPGGPAGAVAPGAAAGGAVAREILSLQRTAARMMPELAGMLPVAPVAVAPEASALKEKRRIVAGGADHNKWVWAQFANPARGDAFTLPHWVRKSETDDEYEYARYNRAVEVPRYTDDEYARLFACADWTRDETDALFDLAQRYDVRWPVVADRWEHGRPRSMEELKERYYSVAARVVEIHARPDEDLSDHPLRRFQYNRKSEEERKAAADKLWSRTREQIEEEEELLQVCRRIAEQNKRAYKEQRRSSLVMQQFGAFASPSFAEPPAPKPPRKRQRRVDDDDDDEADDDASQASSAAAAPPAAATPARERPERSSTGGGDKSKHAHTMRAFLRSQDMLLPQHPKETTKQIVEIMEKLGVPHHPITFVPLVVPTQAVAETYKKLRADIALLIEMRKNLSYKDYLGKVSAPMKK
eukprot:m51a1_g12041 putative dna methyltransferase 1-associated protein 1 (460) ;mRNA; f:3596-6039